MTGRAGTTHSVAAPETAGMDPDALQRVEDLFREQIEQGVHPGAVLAAYRHGSLVLDLCGGVADAKAGKPVTADTMFVLYSCTKPLTAACLYMLWEREQVAWDDRVAEYWPGFGRNGKDKVTVRHVLTHQAGFPDTPAELSWDRWQDWDFIVETMERITPVYKPGEIIAYHPRNFGWVIGELVRRIDGRPIAQFLQEEITAPLDMSDTYLGLPVSLEHRVSRVHAMDDCDRPSMPATYNKPGVHQAVQPGGGGIATARDLARFFAMMAGGGSWNSTRIFESDTVAEVTGLQVEGMDHTAGRPVQRSLGLSLADSRTGAQDQLTPTTFGHGGAGTSIGWADPTSGLAVAYITNGFRAEHSNTERLSSISQAVRDACL